MTPSNTNTTTYYDPSTKRIWSNGGNSGTTVSIVGTVIDVNGHDDDKKCWWKGGKKLRGEILDIVTPNEVPRSTARPGGQHDDVSRTEQPLAGASREVEERHNDDHNTELEKEVDASPEQPVIIVPEPYNDDDDASFQEKEVEPTPLSSNRSKSPTETNTPPTNTTTTMINQEENAAIPKKLDRTTLESNKSNEIKQLMHDKSLSRLQRKQSLEEIKSRYNMLLEQCVDDSGVGADNNNDRSGVNDTNINEAQRTARRKAELAAVMKDRSLDKQTRLKKLSEIKSRYSVDDGDNNRRYGRRKTVESSGSGSNDNIRGDNKSVPVDIVFDRENDSGGEEEHVHHRHGGTEKQHSSRDKESSRHYGRKRSTPQHEPKEKRVDAMEKVSSDDKVHNHQRNKRDTRQEKVEVEEVSSDDDDAHVKRSRNESVKVEEVSSDEDEAYNRHATPSSRQEQSLAEEESSRDGGSRSNTQVQDEHHSSRRGSYSDDDDDDSSVMGGASKDVADNNDDLSYGSSLGGVSRDVKSSQSSGSYRSSQQDTVSSEEGDRIGELSSSRRSAFDDDVSKEEMEEAVPLSKPSANNVAGYVPGSRKLNRKNSAGSSSSNKKSVTISEPSSTNTSARSLGINPLENAEVNKTPIKTLIRKLDKNDPSLTVLKLDGRGKIKEGDWESFFSVLESNTTLTHLSLGRCGMTDDLIVGLILALVDNSTLIALHLMSNKGVTEITGKGIVKVLKESNKTLKQLDLSKTKVKKSTLNEIQTIMDDRDEAKKRAKAQSLRQSKLMSILYTTASDKVAEERRISNLLLDSEDESNKSDDSEDSRSKSSSLKKSSASSSKFSKRKNSMESHKSSVKSAASASSSKKSAGSKSSKNANSRTSGSIQNNGRLNGRRTAGRGGRGNRASTTVRASITARQMATMGGELVTGIAQDAKGLREQRKMRGECLTCGQKCFEKKLFKTTPLSIPNKVHEGRCLKCNPM